MWAVVLRAFFMMFVSTLMKYGGQILAKVLIWFGLSFVTYRLGVTELGGLVRQNMAGLPPVALDVIAICQVDKAITMLLSAYAVRAASNIRMTRTTGTNSP